MLIEVRGSIEQHKDKKRQCVSGFVLILFVLLLTACGGSPTSGSTKSVQVNETDFKIVSDTTTFMPGASYHFIVTNNGHTAHEFMIMPSSMQSMGGMSMGEMDKMALAKVENITPGQTATIDYTFASSLAGSHPEFACYYTGHYEAGMKQDVTVNS